MTSTTSAPCTCIRPTSRSGSAPIARAARARFSQHGVARVAAGQAAVEAGVGPAGDAALAREEAMRHAERVGSERHGVAFGGAAGRCPGSTASKPGGVGRGSSGWQTASALNSRPMRSGSASRRAASISAEPRAGGCVRARRSVRWNRPRRVRNTPCGSGPWTAAPASRAAAAKAAKSTCAVRSAVPGAASGSAGRPSRRACRLSPGALCSGP